MTINNIDKMIELSQSKKECLRQVLDLTKEQRNFIQNEDMNKLNNIISNKDKLMNDINLLDLDFLALYNETRRVENIETMDEINSTKYNNLGDLQNIINNINDILSEISSIDKENTEVMKKNLEDVKSGLKQVKEIKRAYKGYGHEISGSILIDEKK